MTIYLLYLLGGLVFLIKGADLLISGASAIAEKFKLSHLFIGLTIVAFGTSAPELFVNVFASFKGNTDLALSNILGSNLANILLILGLSATVYPLKFKKEVVWRQIPIGLFAIMAVALLAKWNFSQELMISGISRINGVALMLFFFIFLTYLFFTKSDSAILEEKIKEYSLSQASLMTVLGFFGLGLGGEWVVSAAVGLSEILGISESFIGLTVVSVGTSLPELVTSILAAYKMNSDIAIGNIVGSNIFNIFWVLGLSAFIRPMVFSYNFSKDIYAVIAATLLLFVFMFLGEKYTLGRFKGLIFLAFYFSYILASYYLI